MNIFNHAMVGRARTAYKARHNGIDQHPFNGCSRPKPLGSSF